MSSYFYSFSTPTVGERKKQAEKKIKQLRAKGREIEPLGELPHRTKIATSFWGAAWCKHLESYSDYSTRLPRGRTYVRSGSVLHLGVEPGFISALVQGSELYEETVKIDPLPASKWEGIQARCRGKIGSLIELLQGKISDEIMTIVTDKTSGLFPAPREIHFTCSCPDHASMCKHIAAVLYGVGARLDTHPELLFKLRGVDHNNLISTADTTGSLSARPASGKGRRRLAHGASLSDIFGAEIEPLDVVTPPPVAEPKPVAPALNEAALLPFQEVEADAAVEQRPALTMMTLADIREIERKREKEAASKLLKLKKLNPKPPRTTPLEHTGNSVRALRMRLEMSHKRLAKKLKITEQTLFRWEDKGTAKLTIREPGLSALNALENMYPPAP